MTGKPAAMFVTDLDGTLLRSDRTLSRDDVSAMSGLGEAGVIRTIATGRIPFSFRRLLGEQALPVDYLVLSTGTGIIDYSSGEVLLSRGLTQDETASVCGEMTRLDLDFSVQDEFPENHRALYRLSGRDNPDFYRRLSFYREYSREFPPGEPVTGVSAQVVAVVPQSAGMQAWKETVDALGSDFSLVRTTSPLDGESMWIEVLPAGVSKGTAAAWLEERLGVQRHLTAAVGNDYNDLDLLDWAHTSYVVANAPVNLSPDSTVVASNDECGVAMAVGHWMDTLGGSP